MAFSKHVLCLACVARSILQVPGLGAMRWLPFIAAGSGSLAAASDLGSGMMEADPSAWPIGLWAASGTEQEARDAVAGLVVPGAACQQVHEAVILVVSQGGLAAGLAMGAVVQLIHQLAEQLGTGEDVQYAVLFGEVATALRAALEVVQLLSIAAMVHKECFRSAARQVMGKALLPLQAAVQQQISTMWWMFDIGQYSNTNSPAKHFQAVHTSLKHVEAMFAELSAQLQAVLHDQAFAWGHQEHGMFMNSTVMYRKLFPEAALVDKGLLRSLLRLLPHDSTLADFGALDGHYARWLNDTALVTAYAFDGVQGVGELTDGSVTEADLAGELRVPWRPEGFDFALCLEVAEHIPPDLEGIFLQNLDRHAVQGLVLSWATPDIEGEGHVNCLPLEESRRRIEALGFMQDEEATEALRAAAQLPWIAKSVALYRRVPG